MSPTSALFAEGDLSANLDNQMSIARKAVEEIPEARFRSSDPTELATELFRRFNVEPVILTEGAVSVQAEEADVDHRNFGDIDWGFPGASSTLRGTRVTYNVPFIGDPTIFRLRPSRRTAMSPRGEIGHSELQFIYEVPSDQVADTKAMFYKDLNLTKQYLSSGNAQVERFNEELARAIEGGVNQRHQRLILASEGLAALGLPVRKAEPAKISHELVSVSGPLRSRGESQRDNQYDVALSFAGEDRSYVQQVADILRAEGVAVFYDDFEKVSLWGKDLVEHLQHIYQNQARFCVLFVSKHYVEKPWPTHERRSAQARALLAKEEYLLPARFDDSVVPGLAPTVGYVDLRAHTPAEFAEMILAKIGAGRAGG